MIIREIKVNFKILFFVGLFGILLFVLTSYAGFSLIPSIINDKILKEKILREGTDQWKHFMKVPFPFQFKVYLFNIENTEDVLQGAKPVVKEKGPYVYKLQRWKDEVSWNNATDEISYNDYETYEFDQEASGELMEKDTVTILNLPFLSFLYTAEMNESTQNFLPAIDEALPFIFGENNGPFLVNTTVRNFLFDGIRICKDGCAKDGFIPSMVCGMMKKKLDVAKQMRMDGKDILYATFHYRNNTHQGFLTIKSGITQNQEIGILTHLDNETDVAAWIDDEYRCNKIGGLTTVFPQNVDAKTRLESFSEDICRIIQMGFSRTEKILGIKGYRYVALETSFSSPENMPENQCYCINKTQNFDGNFGCLYDGVLDLTTCQGAPVLISFPHFLHGDTRYINSVYGLRPNRTKHEMFVTLEPKSGIPLKVAKRVQFNMFLRNVTGIQLLKYVSHSLVPIFWVEELFTLPKEYADKIQSELFGRLRVIEIVKYILLAMALAVILTCLVLFVYAI